MALHTDSGRLGRVLPANTPLAPLASYTAGPGTLVGLFPSPTAVAVTNPGTLIGLETGASQLAAFDLNGNPVRQFGTSTATAATCTLALLPPRTYLDLAVDGSGQIYVLSHQGDGSQPVQYRIDVFSPTGAPISTQSIGNNIPHLAVDYWRGIYAANFTALLEAGTAQPRIDPALGWPSRRSADSIRHERHPRAVRERQPLGLLHPSRPASRAISRAPRFTGARASVPTSTARRPATPFSMVQRERRGAGRRQEAGVDRDLGVVAQTVSRADGALPRVA